MSAKGLATSAHGWGPTVGREGFPELLEELEILMGLNAPTLPAPAEAAHVA